MHKQADIVWHKLRKLVAYGLIVAGLALIGLALAQRMSQSAVQASPSVIVQWQDVAHEVGLPESLIDRLTELIAEGLDVLPPTSAAPPHPDIRDSLRRFLGEFRWAFSDSEQGSEFSHYVAWLVLESVRREDPSQAALARARQNFDRCLEALQIRLRSDLRERFGSDYAKYEKAIETGIRWTKDRLMKRFNVLQADPLFPSFKGPLEEKAITLAVESAADPARYDLMFAEPLPMMAEEEKVYIRRLENFFETCPKQLLFGLVQGDIDERLRLNPYWGPVDYTMIGTSGDYCWPMQVRLHRRPTVEMSGRE